jgi:hypothetical protein
MSVLSSVPVSDESVSGGDIIEFFEFSRLPRTRITYSGYGGQGLQTFTTSRIAVISPGQSLAIKQTSANPEVLAVRVPSDTNYIINGTGGTGILPAGTYTSFAKHVTSIKFPDGGTIEVM